MMDIDPTVVGRIDLVSYDDVGALPKRTILVCYGSLVCARLIERCLAERLGNYFARARLLPAIPTVALLSVARRNYSSFYLSIAN